MTTQSSIDNNSWPAIIKAPNLSGIATYSTKAREEAFLYSCEFKLMVYKRLSVALLEQKTEWFCRHEAPVTRFIELH